MNPPQPIPDPEVLLRHAGWVRRLAQSLVADPNLADDLRQEALLRSLHSAPTEPSHLRRWFGRVLRNLRADHQVAEHRRKTREREVGPVGLEEPPDEVLARAELHRRLVEVVLALREPYRMTLLMRFFEELPASVIAVRLGVPVETVRTRVKRGIAQLRTDLDQECGGDRLAWFASMTAWAEVASTVGTGLKGATVMTSLGKVMVGAVVVLAAAAYVILDGPEGNEPEGDPATGSGTGAAVAATGEGTLEAAPGVEPDVAPTGRNEDTRVASPVVPGREVLVTRYRAYGSPTKVDERPLGSGTLSFLRLGEERTVRVKTEDDGTADLANVPEGEYEVAVEDQPWFAIRSGTITVPASDKPLPFERMQMVEHGVAVIHSEDLGSARQPVLRIRVDNSWTATRGTGDREVEVDPANPMVWPLMVGRRYEFVLETDGEDVARAECVADAGRQHVWLESPGCLVQVHVVQDGQAVVGTRVRARGNMSPEHEAHWLELELPDEIRTTDADGWCEFPLMNGPYLFSVQADGAMSVVETVRVEGDREVTLDLSQLCHLNCRVESRLGKLDELKARALELERVDSDPLGIMSTNVPVHADGTFVIQPLIANSQYLVKVSRGNAWVASALVRGDAGTLTLMERAPASLRVTVQEPNDEPSLATAWKPILDLRHAQTGLRYMLHPEGRVAGGLVTFGNGGIGLVPGPYRLSVYWPHCESVVDLLVEVEEGVENSLDLQLNPAPPLTLEVIGESGAPLDRFSLSMDIVTPKRRNINLVNLGRFLSSPAVLHTAIRGEFHLMVDREGFEPWSGRINSEDLDTDSSGEGRRIVIRLKRKRD